MVRSPRELCREDGEWRLPDGREGEVLALLVGLPLLTWVAVGDLGGLAPGDGWLAVVVGVCCGLGYALWYRRRLLAAVPDWVGAGTAVSLVTGGFGLSVLELVHLAAPTVLFVLAAGSTVFSIYALRLVSPMHDGMAPQRRGVEPPSASELDG